MEIYQIFRIDENQLIDCGTQQLEDSINENGVISIPTSDLPADFSVDTYTIVDNALVPASAEIIAERRAIQAIATHEAIRLSRQQRYDSEAVTSLYWNWQESGAKTDKIKWLEAKEAIRQELPYAEQTEQHENHLKLNNL